MQANTIVIGVELDNHAERLIAEATNLAAANQSAVHAISVFEPHLGLLRRAHAEAGRVEEVLDTLEHLTKTLARNARKLTLHARLGKPAEEIIHLAIECNADLIVVGNFHQHDLTRSSVSKVVLQQAACSVLVVAPNRENAEHGGLIPKYTLCGACDADRVKSGGVSWYCDSHTDPKVRSSRRIE